MLAGHKVILAVAILALPLAAPPPIRRPSFICGATPAITSAGARPITETSATVGSILRTPLIATAMVWPTTSSSPGWGTLSESSSPCNSVPTSYPAPI